MCGICGYVGDHQPDLLEPMCRAMETRGPDDMGTWHDAAAQVGFGHRRLSIIDLSAAGHQPMCNEDQTVWISYNGELYNFQGHRQHLIDRGHQFKSHTDTEVLIHLYEEMGPEFLNELNGMFALAIWDQKKRQLLLARDHAGVKPLYYWYDGRRLFFASEIKALLRVPGMPRELNASAIPDYLAFLWLPGEETMLKGIKKLEPGNLLVWRDGTINKRQWFSIAYEPDESVSEDQWVEKVHDGFMEATRRQMVSDVPLGAFLSGGTDSSAIVACMRNSFPDREIKCYTYYCDPKDMVRDQFEEDYPFAKRVAEHLNVTLDSFLLRPNCISLLTKMIFSVEEPDADPTVFPNYLISKRAREDGTTVLLSGMGGDEVFFGYRSHQALRLYQRLDKLPSWLLGPALAAATSLTASAMGAQSALPRRLSKLRKALSGHGLQRHMTLSDWSSSEARRAILDSQFIESHGWSDAPENRLKEYFDGFRGAGDLNRRSYVLIQSFLGAHNFLYTDKSSMAVSLEVRVPFMDVELLRLCARIPEHHQLKGQTTKYLLKKAMERYLPRDILHRSKTGFGPPLRTWVAADLDHVTDELLAPSRIRSRGFFDPIAIQRVLEENRTNKADHAYLVYALMTLELWLQTFIDQPGVEVTL
jgi:asparagine synthase (glutamine-hydrolysing)